MPEYLKKELKYRTVEELKRILRYRKFFSKNTIASAQYYLAHQDELVPTKDRPSPNDDFPDVPHALLLLRMIKVKHLTTYLMFALLILLLQQVNSYYRGERFFENYEYTIRYIPIIFILLANHVVIQRETRLRFTYWVRILNTLILFTFFILVILIRHVIINGLDTLTKEISESLAGLLAAFIVALPFELAVGWTLHFMRWIKGRLA